MKNEGMRKGLREKGLKVLVCIFVLGIFLFASSGEVAAQDTLSVEVFGSYNRETAQEIFQQVNEFRIGEGAWYWDENNSEKVRPEGVKELVYDYDLQVIAEQRAAEIALSYSHTRPNGSSCFTAFEESENSYISMGENIAAGQDSAGEVFEEWKEEDKDYAGQGHRRNMLEADFNAIGIAVFTVDNVKFWVQEFGYTDTPNTAKPEEEDDSYVSRYMPVTIDVSDDSGTTLSNIRPRNSVIALAPSNGDRVPDVNAKLKMKDSFQANGSSVIVNDVMWTIEDENIVEFQEFNDVLMVQGLGTIGKTAISANVLGTTVSVQIYVTEDGTLDNESDNIPIDETHFPDKAFRDYISAEIDVSGTGYLSAATISECSQIFIQDDFGTVKDFSGIEYFTNIVSLDLSGHDMKELDLSRNQKLEEIEIEECASLRTINLSENSYLQNLTLGDLPALESLDLSGNSDLIYLELVNLPALETFCLPKTKTMASLRLDNVSMNPELDLSNYDKLSTFTAYHMQFDSLNFNGCSSLKALNISGLQLKELSVKDCMAMEDLDCAQNELVALDVSGMTKLKSLDCSRNQIQTLALNGNAKLENIICGYNQIKELAVSECTQLINLECQENKIASLILGNEKLESLDCSSNPVGMLELEQCPNLEWLLCSNCSLRELDVTYNSKLVRLNCDTGLYSNTANVFSEIIGLDKLTQIQVLNASGVSLTSMDLSNCTKLKCLLLDCNPDLKELDLTAVTKLVELGLTETGITNIDLSKNTELLYLSMSRAKLEKLDLSYNTKLENVNVSENQLKVLDVSANKELVWLDCDDNEISELNIGGCANLHALECSRNKLFRLDISSNPNIGYISATELLYEDEDGNRSQSSFTTYLHAFEFSEVYGEEYKEKIFDLDYWNQSSSYETGIITASLESDDNEEMTALSIPENSEEEEKSLESLSEDEAECYIVQYIDVPESAVSGKTIDLSKIVDTSEFDTGKIGKQHHVSVSGTKVTVTGNPNRLYFDYYEPVFVSDSGLKFPLRFEIRLSTRANEIITDALYQIVELPSYTPKTGSYKGVYNGKSHTISLSGVKSGSSITYRTSTNQSWSKTKPTRKAVGKTTVYYKITNSKYKTITGSKTITILPKGTSIKKLSGSKKSFTVKWKKQATQTNGYQVRYSLKSNMSGAKVKNIPKTGTTSKKITGLKKKKNYYVQIRTYKKVNGVTYYSSWSAKKKVKVK